MNFFSMLSLNLVNVLDVRQEIKNGIKKSRSGSFSLDK